jgi:plastocyanin
MTARYILALIIGCLTVVQACREDSISPPDNGGTTNTIILTNNAFNPSEFTVAVGTTVTWRNTDNVDHTSTSDDGSWDTGNIAPGASATTTFNQAGTFGYHCTYHRTLGMTGTITVQ